MRRYWKIIAILALVSLLAPGVSSISVGNIDISPSGDLVSGQTQVRASFIVNFPVSGGYTFESENSLQLSSELSDPTWTYIIVQDEHDNPSKTEVGPNVNINGWILSYRSPTEISMKVTLEGLAPTVTATAEKTVVAVRELDSRGSKVSGSEVVKKAKVINPAQIQQSIATSKTSLDSLKAQIDQLAALGIDVSSLEQKYNQGSTAIQNAQKTSDYSKAQTYLTEANKAISEGQALYQQLNTQKMIADVDAKVEQANALINDFRVNRSMSSDARLTPILIKYDAAADLVSEAKDLVSQGKYEDAQAKISAADSKAQDALNEALALQKDLDANPLFAVAGALAGGIVIIIAVVVIVVVAVVGFILFRRRRRWDELG